MNKFRQKWAVLAVVWFVLLVYALLSKQPISVPAVPVPHLDKLAHMGLFFGQFWLFARMIALQFHHKKAWVVLILLSLLLAVLTEFIQGLTATRLMDKYDGLADVIGAVSALALASYAQKLKWFKH